VTPLPALLAPSAPLIGWRIDEQRFAPLWDSGIGSEKFGGRWNPKGLRVVYASFDPATTILETAVHRGFKVLDINPFKLTSFSILDPASVHVVDPSTLPNPGWLQNGLPSAGQQHFGEQLLNEHAFVVFASVVSHQSWNIVFRPDVAAGLYELVDQTNLVVDTRLNPP
jgi:RES domain-containing protein